jgi:hypothetical protein
MKSDRDSPRIYTTFSGVSISEIVSVQTARWSEGREMRERDFYREPDWDWFPRAPRTRDDDAGDPGKADENPPRGVLGEMALVLVVSLAIVLIIGLALAMLHNP